MTRKSKSRNVASPPAAPAELVARVGLAVRKMGAESVIISRTIADKFQLNTTDLEVLDLIFLREQATAGELADATGLTSGSITALIDRLANAGYVERRADPADRRKVLVRICKEAIDPIKAVYAVTQRRMFALWSTFSARDLEVIADFLARSTDLAAERCKEIQKAAQPTSLPRRAPRNRRPPRHDRGDVSIPDPVSRLRPKRKQALPDPLR